MHCLSPVQKLCPRLDGVQEPRRKGRHVLQKPSSRDLRRLLGTLRHGLPGAHEHAQSDAEIGSIWIQATVNSALSIEKSPERAKRSGATHAPGLPGQVRRTRGVTPAKWSETPNMKSNGHDTSTSRVNGHGPVSPSRAAQYTEVPREQGRAASDDARDFPAAAGASSAPSGKERDACAEVAPPSEGESKHQPKPKKSGKKADGDTPRGPSDDKNKKKRSVNIPPGSKPLPADGVGFVDAMHAHVDLYLACARLVKSGDEKIAQRMVERLLEMSYGKSPAPAGDEMPQIIFDAPRPIED
jgi:hypothetical protein